MQQGAKNDMLRKIAEARKEMRSAGIIHKRDLARSIRNMEKQLRIYDKFQRQERC